MPTTLIYPYFLKLKKIKISLGAQNCHFIDSYGPFTGSINAKMIKKSGAKYIILGHSDNRAEGDDNFLISKKIVSALNQDLNVIFCIGETLKEKRSKKTLTVLKKQIKDSIKSSFDLKKIFFAYEPIWSIGSGKIPKNTEIEMIVKFIKKYVRTKFKFKETKVLYGGSVDGKNVKFFSKIFEIDGFFNWRSITIIKEIY